ncbi:hypothetical protein KQ247_15705 [Ruegeria pomeroyi]|jgi:hypothetical protein|uniref:Uncharacterized protein n=1 Tax=Ruegeria pomeroyi TaxID=89184 RepID=A0A850LCI2_9RHOB|nr:hypothetical protein [Ruegeria pomeroyi]NVK95796.1 hypothetical protein [Ruegeria pomeroyi]NVL00042.1 hypothetical protein [Ruegeria pomeroyi]QWV08249.1 hypothetical protein KQ247_15705 [Ruegeria pomeroyi]HCE70882.1 hypothetical protein [Ruegeria sp.]
MVNEEARVAAEGIWMIAFFSFMVFVFYRHFFVQPFNHWELLDPTHENYRFNRKVFLVFAAILSSGFLLFAVFPRT